MIRQQLARLLAVILTISCIAGSVGMTALASEADSLSTDIVISENSEDAGASDERPETAPVTGREEETAEEEACLMEHAISDESFDKWVAYIDKMGLVENE